jgi:hypothetical protein
MDGAVVSVISYKLLSAWFVATVLVMYAVQCIFCHLIQVKTVNLPSSDIIVLVTRYSDDDVRSREIPTAAHILGLKGSRGVIQPGNF